MDKITRTKLAMLVTSVLLTIFTTIGLYYTMTVSNAITLGNSDPLVLNFSMVLAIMITFMWVIVLILFYEFKTDDAIKTEIRKLNESVIEVTDRANALEDYKTMLETTKFPPSVVDPDVLEEGGVTGHIPDYSPK